MTRPIGTEKAGSSARGRDSGVQAEGKGQALAPVCVPSLSKRTLSADSLQSAGLGEGAQGLGPAFLGSPLSPPPCWG